MKSFFVSLFLTIIVSAEDYKLEASLDMFINLPTAYDITPASLEKTFEKGTFSENPYFSWLNEEKSRAIFKKNSATNVFVDLTILEKSIKVDELIIDFEGGLFKGCTISIFNKADSGNLSAREFDRRTLAVGKHISKQLNNRARRRTEKKSKGILTSGYIWKSPRGIAALEYNDGAQNGQAGFVRLRLAKIDAGGIYAAAIRDRSTATIGRSALKQLITKQGSEVIIENIPMVDQGSKGYCLVASVQRLFEYYGISCDMYQLAEIAGSDPRSGTDTKEANRQLDKIDHLFKTRFICYAVGDDNNGLTEPTNGDYIGDPIPQKDFEKEITRSIDKGLPLVWSLTLGKYKETPPLQEQQSGGHSRLIIGYDLEKRLLYFTDSWGLGHQKKFMRLDDAYKCTTGLFSIVPKAS